jgi:hypothetical protein
MSSTIISSLPREISNDIINRRNRLIRSEAEDDEANFQNLIDNDFAMYVFADTLLVPYYDDRNNIFQKKLTNIDVISDGYRNNNIINPWRYPVNNWNKTETLRNLYNQENEEYVYGGMVNKKVKKCENKKVVLGKERCIYKVSGSKKDYMKYKGKLVPVADYIKSMKKKN